MINLKGNIVVVTGASGRIGSGIARRFAAAGASIILHYQSNSESVTKLAGELPVKTIPGAVLPWIMEEKLDPCWPDREYRITGEQILKKLECSSIPITRV